MTIEKTKMATPESTVLTSWHILPNAFTMLALSSGMTGLFYAAGGRYGSAIACVLVAAILDACDGRVARATGTASKFGAELDSLADVICFGAVPAFILYQWQLHAFGLGGWLLALLLPMAAAFRLARFNVAVDAVKPSWMSSYFTGIPAPAGAYLALVPIFVANTGIFGATGNAVVTAATPPLVALLMVSTWPTFSGKSLGRRALGIMYLPSLALLVAAAAGLFFFPWATLSLSGILYLATLPLSKWRFSVLRERSPGA